MALYFDLSSIFFLWIGTLVCALSFVDQLSSNIKSANFKVTDSFVLNYAFAVFPIIFIGYFFFSYLFLEGQTLGKKRFKVHTFQKKSIKMYFLRAALQFVSYSTFGLPNIYAFFEKNGRSLIDITVGSTHSSINEIEVENTDNKILALEFKKSA
jgi:uncharacterized RDD family membrane protein YckC